MWKLLKHVLASKIRDTVCPVSCEKFNSFFSQVGDKLTLGFGSIVVPSVDADIPINTSFQFLEINVN